MRKFQLPPSRNPFLPLPPALATSLIRSHVTSESIYWLRCVYHAPEGKRRARRGRGGGGGSEFHGARLSLYPARGRRFIPRRKSNTRTLWETHLKLSNRRRLMVSRARKRVRLRQAPHPHRGSRYPILLRPILNVSFDLQKKRGREGRGSATVYKLHKYKIDSNSLGAPIRISPTARARLFSSRPKTAGRGSSLLSLPGRAAQRPVYRANNGSAVPTRRGGYQT